VSSRGPVKLLFHIVLGVPSRHIDLGVFFVISGFMITDIITRELEQCKFNFVGFYARRSRRILPALQAVMLLFSLAALVILFPTDLEHYAKSVMAALLSLSNFLFLSQGGYFGTTSEFTSTLLTWSLAVEEQYFFLLPVDLTPMLEVAFCEYMISFQKLRSK
jgi:peptidoglycan/LPS O-acetylase OafA/YrhL